MESPCLSILVPLLVKGLREKAAVVRKTAVIIDNMVKVRRISVTCVFDPLSMRGPDFGMLHRMSASSCVCGSSRDHM